MHPDAIRMKSADDVLPNADAATSVGHPSHPHKRNTFHLGSGFFNRKLSIFRQYYKNLYNTVVGNEINFHLCLNM